jgi:hypothetical protein
MGDRMVQAAVRIQRAAADYAPRTAGRRDFDREPLRWTAVRDIDRVDRYSAWHVIPDNLMASAHSSG